MVVLSVIAATFDVDFDDPAVLTLATNTWLYTAVLAWVVWMFARHRISLRRMLGRIPKDFRWLPTVSILVPTVLFSIGSLLITLYLISFSSPGRVESYVERDLFGEAGGLAVPIISVIALVLTLLVVAPIVEELLFRGILLHRWAMKWRLGTAVVVCSVAFGFVHQLNFFGATAFGLVMALVYLRTRTLLVPMACHVLNNAVVVGFSVIFEGVREVFGDSDKVYTVEQVRDELWVGVVLVAVSLPWLAVFVYKNWPRQGARAPYFIPEGLFGEIG